MPDVEYPAVQAHVVEPEVLVLPVGHAVQLVAPATLLYVLAAQTRLVNRGFMNTL